ncbi:MFS transporter [Pseudomonas sp. RIT-PI-AD]|uniref:MFS transporter n=1 Tax=Pseudomonas sp. RIT-PI-AD TaxID=3035294 RepID=UPI0021DB56A2|nr:MFS transporter [Pseudomonas sp. RIT-PI-AD]
MTALSIPATAEEDSVVKSAVRKFYRRMVPLTVLMLLINQIDRTNLGFVQDALKADLGIGAAAFGLGAGLFFVGYALFEVPSNLYLKRLGARIWLTRIMITWGAVTLAMAFTGGETSFYVLRFLLGAMEAGFFPGVIFYYSVWLPDAHRGRAVAIFLSASALAYIVTGPISGALLEMHGWLGIAGWRWMFLIEGGVSMLVGLLSIIWLVSRIDDARWLSLEEKRALGDAVARDEAVRQTEARHLTQLQLLLQPTVIKLCAIYFISVMTGYTVTFWLPGILRQIDGIDNFQVGLLSAVPWLFAVAAMYVLAKLTDDKGHRRALVAGSMALMAAGMALATLGSPWFALFALTLAAVGYKSCNSVFWSMTAVSLEPKVLAAGIALINSLGNLGGFAAPAAFGVIKEQTGSIQGGLLGLTACSLIGLVLVLSLKVRKGV